MGNACSSAPEIVDRDSRDNQMLDDSKPQTIGAPCATNNEHVSVDVTQPGEDLGQFDTILSSQTSPELVERQGLAASVTPPQRVPRDVGGFFGHSCCSVTRNCPALIACSTQADVDPLEGPAELEEEEIGQLPMPKGADAEVSKEVGFNGNGTMLADATLLAEIGKPMEHDACTNGHSKRKIRWDLIQPGLFGVFVVFVVFMSAFARGWLSPTEDDDGEFSVESILRYGSIPVIAAIIGYTTNVVALEMMFYPIEFIGFFPNLKIGCGLDLPLFGWQGVIPMRAEQMATISVTLMTQKLIHVDEIFSRLDPKRVVEEVEEQLSEVVPAVVNAAGRAHLPTMWEHLPTSVRLQLEERVVTDSKPMMSHFITDLQKNIEGVFDLKQCVVDVLVSEPQILNNMFLICGAEEFKFIRISGFYLGFLFGILQMVVWMFVKEWWILPLCGIFVGYFTNVIALKVIFLPIEPIPVCGGRWIVQGLFLKRQREVSALYGQETAEKILSAPVLMHALVHGPLAEKMFRLVDKHVVKCMEDQAAAYKPALLLAMGADGWIGFREGVCTEFRQRLPALLTKIQDYMQEAMQLETTLRTRLEGLPSRDFERLLHAVFEQDEIKLILVGALLGAIVGFLQALVQTPDQLGF